MEHIYTLLNSDTDNTTILYNHIYKGTLAQQIIVYKRFATKFAKREELKNSNINLNPM